jgi:hypothetical protein
MQAQEPAQIAERLAELRREHRELDTAIHEGARTRRLDEMQLSRMKKRKLLLKDTIARMESQLIPDLDA